MVVMRWYGSIRVGGCARKLHEVIPCTFINFTSGVGYAVVFHSASNHARILSTTVQTAANSWEPTEEYEQIVKVCISCIVSQVLFKAVLLYFN
ncbi:hypothetical protein ANCCAN_05526 [Ancylostoma caninum]|uniref:Uncharacterized protein n=1 Tax=Ancylostoma caninum TaxID=29170 RepID=A0A368GXS5_ANCCA|nr:hypothetical protein ANCCAN_05526 [Ancylostoma caninum]